MRRRVARRNRERTALGKEGREAANPRMFNKTLKG